MRTSRCMPPPLPTVLNVSSAPNTVARKSTSPGPGARRYGVIVVNPSRVSVSTACDIVVLRCRLALSRSLNAGAGTCLKSTAIRASGARSGSRRAAVASRRARIASMVSSRRSTSVSSATLGLHALPQALERAQLQLLDRAFRSVQRRRHLADALLLDEPHLDHPALRVRQPLDELRQHRAQLDPFGLPLVGHVRW